MVDLAYMGGGLDWVGPVADQCGEAFPGGGGIFLFADDSLGNSKSPTRRVRINIMQIGACCIIYIYTS